MSDSPGAVLEALEQRLARERTTVRMKNVIFDGLMSELARCVDERLDAVRAVTQIEAAIDMVRSKVETSTVAPAAAHLQVVPTRRGRRV